MEERVQTITIIIYNRDKVYDKVSELLHRFSEKIKLRVGYPMPDKNISIIFLVAELNNDELGALSGKLGQIKSVKVKTNSLSI